MIKHALNDQDVTQCFEVLAPLRPHLSATEFVTSANRLARTTGYQLVYLDDDGIKAVAGYRVPEWLHTGKYLEIEELITKDGERSKGYGSVLFDWLVDFARGAHCNQVRLVSGVSRELAHKFYLDKGTTYEAKYFSLNVQR